MAPATGPESACPECGAFRRAADPSCFLCGRRFDSDPEVAPAAGKPFNPYDPPPPALLERPAAAPGSLRLTFRISSLLLIIAVVAVCLGVWQAQPILGACLAVVAVPALGYVCVIGFKSASAGKPMAVPDKLSSFLAALWGVVLVEFAALVAFCMTCVPAGFVAMSADAAGETGFIVALVLGGVGAFAGGAYVAYWLIKTKPFGVRSEKRR
jgi:hypothetical protein